MSKSVACPSETPVPPGSPAPSSVAQVTGANIASSTRYTHLGSNLTIEHVPVSALRPYSRNARIHSAKQTPLLDPRTRADNGALAAEVAALAGMTAIDLRAEWRRLYRAHPPKKLSRDLLELGVAWKLQERVLGGLGATTKRQLTELARTMETKSDLALARKVSLKPGARLLRAWGGETHEVVVVDDGFLWRGKTWGSLSVIAREMTGTRWSGPRFFGLDKRKADLAGRDLAADWRGNE
jgi:hypothetical protein